MARSNREKQKAERTSTATAQPAPTFVEPLQERSVEELFGGSRPASFLSALEPAFLLIDRVVMDQLRVKAEALGMGGYDSLVKRILREHIGEY
jgi:hypothetical protein